MSKKVLFALTSHDQLGDVSFVSVDGGQVPLDGLEDGDTKTQDFLARDEIREALMNTPKAEDLSAGDYDVIYFAGGHGTMWDFRDCAPLAQLAANVYDKGGVVAAVCHGPAGLVNIKLQDGNYLIDGKQVSSFTNEEESAVGLNDTVPFLLEDALTARGAQHSKASNFTEHAVADGRLVTGQNPASAVKVAELAVFADKN